MRIKVRIKWRHQWGWENRDRGKANYMYVTLLNILGKWRKKYEINEIGFSSVIRLLFNLKWTLQTMLGVILKKYFITLRNLTKFLEGRSSQVAFSFVVISNNVLDWDQTILVKINKSKYPRIFGWHFDNNYKYLTSREANTGSVPRDSNEFRLHWRGVNGE